MSSAVLKWSGSVENADWEISDHLKSITVMGKNKVEFVVTIPNCLDMNKHTTHMKYYKN